MKDISCDILVAGAGLAGIAAAVRAAREGASTLLVEKTGFPGGIPVSGMHRYICGLFPTGEHIPVKTLNGGIAEEICSGLKRLSSDTRILQMGKVYVLSFRTKDLVGILKALSEKETGPGILYEKKVVSVTTENSIIKSVTAEGRTGKIRIIPRRVIDCSGDGSLIRLSRAEHQVSPPRKRQLAGFCFKIKGINDPEDMAPISVPYCISAAVRRKKLPPYLKYTKFTKGDVPDEGYCLISIPAGGGAGKISKAGSYAVRAHAILSESLSSFGKSYIDEFSPVILEREGLRMTGEYILTKDDVLSARKFNDGVVKNAWPIEIWDREKGPSFRYLETGAYYEIPLRCLKSMNIKNLYCAGRCISASSEALGSTRVMGTCISLGEQAGLAAAM
ncbi:MAG: FAD-dependent oxidoreductase [Desulfobacteraceae bacterium]|nr:MAG: FAD-dependent oxidoreductase [Desulfobacteraceae bacterium]